MDTIEQSHLIANSAAYALLSIALFLFYKYLTINFDYWSKQGISGPTPVVGLGTLRPYARMRLESLDLDDYTKHGRIYGGFEGRQPVLYLGEPDLLKQIMVKDFNSFCDRRHIDLFDGDIVLGNVLIHLKGEEWKSVRNIISKTFSSGKLKQMVYLIEDSISSTMKTIDRLSSRNEPVDFRNYFSAFTLDVIASCAFGLKLEASENPNCDFVKNARRVFQNSPFAVYLMVLFPAIFRTFKKWLPLDHFTFFAGIAERAIDLRTKESLPRKDLLSLMMETEKEENLKSNYVGATKILKREVIISQAVLFLMAGHETPATTLALLAYHLALHPEVQDRLITEIDETLLENDGKFTYDAVVSMPYLDMVISEVLRMYPPAVRIERTVTDDKFNLNGIQLTRGMLVVIPLYAIQRDPEFYPDPDKFDPERFTAEEKAKRHPFTYLPFGAGPRNCVAMRFALMVVKLGLINVLAKYKFVPCDKTEVPLTISSGPGVSSPKNVYLLLDKRRKD